MIEVGGNTNLREFFGKYDLHEVLDIKVKYNTKAAEHYRRKINAKVADQEFTEEAPSYDEGRTLTDGRRIGKNGLVVLPSEDENEEKKTPNELDIEELKFDENEPNS